MYDILKAGGIREINRKNKNKYWQTKTEMQKENLKSDGAKG